jgi:hypothetical protein
MLAMSIQIVMNFPIFQMYVPTMLVIGLHGWFLHPIAILICDMVVYAEFSIHPIVLLSTSTKMRKEIMHTIKIIIQVQKLFDWFFKN